MEALNELIAGKYRSTAKDIALLPWEQRLEIDIWQAADTSKNNDKNQWCFRLNDRKYDRASQVATLDLAPEDDGEITFSIEAFPHWITRGHVAMEGCFVKDIESVRLRLRQRGQGMTGLETWDSELKKVQDEDTDNSGDVGRSVDTNSAYNTLLQRIASDYSAPNSLPLKPRIDALAIIKGGDTLLETYFGGMTSATPHLTSSCTKTITSILVGIAIDQGLFGLDDVVASYFPDVVDTTWADDPPVRVRHVLSMTAGTEHTLQRAQDLLESSDIEQLVLGWERTAKPGDRYNYDNGLPALAGRLIERLSGLPLAEFAERHLFGPLRITGQIWTEMPRQKRSANLTSSVLASGGLFLTLPEWAKIGQMMLHQGLYEGQRIVSEAYIVEATSRQTSPSDYPYGFYLHLNELGRVGKGPDKGQHLDGVAGYLAIGQGEQILFVAPDMGLVVAAFSSTWFRDPQDSNTDLTVLQCIKDSITSI